MAFDDPRIYIKLADGIREQIRNGDLEVGDPIPMTRINQETGHARQTISKACRVLQGEGLLKRYPGLGWLVVAPAPRAENTGQRQRPLAVVSRSGHGKRDAVPARLPGPDGYDIIQVGELTAVIVPLHEYYVLKALRDRATASELDAAKTDAAVAEHREVGSGRPPW